MAIERKEDKAKTNTAATASVVKPAQGPIRDVPNEQVLRHNGGDEGYHQPQMQKADSQQWGRNDPEPMSGFYSGALGGGQRWGTTVEPISIDVVIKELDATVNSVLANPLKAVIKGMRIANQRIHPAMNNQSRVEVEAALYYLMGRAAISLASHEHPSTPGRWVATQIGPMSNLGRRNIAGRFKDYWIATLETSIPDDDIVDKMAAVFDVEQIDQFVQTIMETVSEE